VSDLDGLVAWLAHRLGADDVDVDDVRRHAEGFSWITWTLTVRFVDADGVPQERGLAIRREPEDGLLAPYDAAQQHAVHAAVEQHSRVPVAPLLWLERDPGVLGRPFYVMERLHGHVPVQWQPDDPVAFPTETARHDLGLQFVDVLAEVHATDWRAAGLDAHLHVPASARDAALHEIARWERLYADAALLEVPLLRSAIGWLRANVATSGVVVLAHGDYRIGNFMVRDGRIVGVFDWELAHLSDPVEDIAYSALPLFRGRSPRFSHLLEADVYFDRYRERTGLHVDPEVFRFWTVLGHLKAAAPHVRACRAFEDGRAGDLRLAAMGHQLLYVLRSLADELGLEPAA
jgi:aminoglycoside phosphotransferase (APT) family kinase protein